MKKTKFTLFGVSSLMVISLMSCSGNKTSDVTKYVVAFDSNGGTEVASQTVNEGEKVTKPADPEKEATAEFTYTFVNWTNGEDVWDFENDVVTSDITLKANYEETKNSYLIKWVSDDGQTELYRGRFEYGTMPVYEGETPTKASSTTLNYTFTGWEPEMTTVVGDATYKAKFSSETRLYTINFVDYDGDVLETYKKEYGATVAFAGEDPERASDGAFDYTFTGWDNEITTVTADATYTAQYSKELNVEKYFGSGREYDVIQDFETTTVSQWHGANVSLAVDTTNKISGNGSLEVTADGFGGFTILMVVGGARITNENWAKYDVVRLYVNADQDGTIYFYNMACPVTKGENVITLSPSKLVEQIDSSTQCYDTAAYFYMQCESGSYSLDALVGIYPEGYVKPTLKDTYIPTDREYDMLQDFESASVCTWAQATVTLSEDHAVTGEHSLKIDASGDWICNVILLLKDGNRLEEADWNKYEEIKIYVYSETATKIALYNHVCSLSIGENEISLTPAEILTQINSNASCYDVTGGFFFQACKGIVYLDSAIGVYPEGYDPTQQEEEPENTYLPTDASTYDMLQDFEGNGIAWAGTTPEYVTDHVVTGSKSAKVTLGGWGGFTVKIVKGGNRIADAEWAQYTSLRMHINASVATTFFILNGSVVDLAAGDNVVDVPVSTIVEQITNSAGKAPTAYDVEGCMYFQVSTAATLYIDGLIGIKNPDYAPADTMEGYFGEEGTYTMIQDFEDSSAIGYCGGTCTFSGTHHISGSKSAKIEIGAWSPYTIRMLDNGNLFTEETWNKYSSLVMYVYLEGESPMDFYLYNKAFWINPGQNKVVMPIADVIQQSKGAAPVAYDSEGCFYMQMPATATMYIDALYGVNA